MTLKQIKNRISRGCGKVFWKGTAKVICEGYDPKRHIFDVDFLCPNCQEKLNLIKEIGEAVIKDIDEAELEEAKDTEQVENE